MRRRLTTIVSITLLLSGCTKEQTPQIDHIIEHRIDSICDYLSSLHYIQADEKIVLYVNDTIADTNLLTDTIVVPNLTLQIYDAELDKTDSCKVSVNEWFGGFLPSNKPGTVCYMSCGGSGAFCDVVEFNYIKHEQGDVLFEVSNCDNILHTDSSFLVQCSSLNHPQAQEDTFHWIEEYDLQGNLIFRSDSLNLQ